MAEFDYKQTPFRKTLTDAEYDLAVGRTPARVLCGEVYCSEQSCNGECGLPQKPKPILGKDECKCDSGPRRLTDESGMSVPEGVQGKEPHISEIRHSQNEFDEIAEHWESAELKKIAKVFGGAERTTALAVDGCTEQSCKGECQPGFYPELL